MAEHRLTVTIIAHGEKDQLEAIVRAKIDSINGMQVTSIKVNTRGERRKTDDEDDAPTLKVTD